MVIPLTNIQNNSIAAKFAIDYLIQLMRCYLNTCWYFNFSLKKRLCCIFGRFGIFDKLGTVN